MSSSPRCPPSWDLIEGSKGEKICTPTPPHPLNFGKVQASEFGEGVEGGRQVPKRREGVGWVGHSWVFSGPSDLDACPM